MPENITKHGPYQCASGDDALLVVWLKCVHVVLFITVIADAVLYIILTYSTTNHSPHIIVMC